LQDARRSERQAREEVQVAQARADAYLAAARRAQLQHDEVEAELRYLLRISLQRQAEFNRKYGPRWREKLSAHKPLTADMLTRKSERKPGADSGGGIANEGS